MSFAFEGKRRRAAAESKIYWGLSWLKSTWYRCSKLGEFHQYRLLMMAKNQSLSLLNLVRWYSMGSCKGISDLCCLSYGLINLDFDVNYHDGTQGELSWWGLVLVMKWNRCWHANNAVRSLPFDDCKGPLFYGSSDLKIFEVWSRPLIISGADPDANIFGSVQLNEKREL